MENTYRNIKTFTKYINRVYKYDRELLSSCLPELISNISDLLYSTRNEVSTEAYETLHLAMKGITK